ncbi:MAG: plasmid pRiA4b ORF-3 family protein, partial [Treponema sp.]|nr:plasmid pRiA4b ORF-3 family protein [Treponema sp.]
IVDEDDLFKVHPIFTRNIMKEETDAYFAALDIGLDRAIKKLKFPRDPQTMIGTIFQEAPDSVRENPKGSFSDYYNNSKKLQMYFIDGQSYLWSSGMDTQSLYTLLQNDELLTPIEKQAKNLDKAMSDMGLLLDPDEIEAFIIDELYQGHTVDAALERCFRGIELVGYLPKQIHNIYEKTKAYGLEIEKNYNADSELKSIAELRSQILIFYESFLLWERQVQPFTDPNIKRSPELNELLDIIKIVSNNIRMLNIPGLKLQASEIKELKAGLKTFKDISLELMKAIELQIKFNTKISPKKNITSSDNIQNTAKNQRPKKKKKSRPAAEKHFILKISLAGIEPEIYRNVLIPGNRSLAEVSEIILATMGWQGYHLHLFDIRGQHYGEPSPDDWDPIEDERKIRLDNLKLRKGSHFEYIYDYGDHWVHDITVLETQKAHPEVEQVPLILEGQRACPPEDCGGISGYMDIIELLTKPKHNLTRDEKEIFEWLPSGYDPEKFDIQKIQEVLSKL